ncbi:hypothetical protein GCM10010319_17390 [Streptomyces blastmyceticus]|uniref:Uncharacterized protein n=1 Tax=Streptomyces blastmyceticus TaxID=68180 RepID=A0ABN0WM84_9ACTN
MITRSSFRTDFAPDPWAGARWGLRREGSCSAGCCADGGAAPLGCSPGSACSAGLLTWLVTASDLPRGGGSHAVVTAGVPTAIVRG